MSGNGRNGTEEHKRKANDCFLNQGGKQNIPKLPIKKNCPESLPNDNVNDSEHIVGEIHATTYKNPNPRQLQKNQLTIESRYNSLIREIEPKIEEQLPAKLSNRLEGVDSESWGMKTLSTLKVSANISKVDNIITSSNAHLIRSTTQQNSLTTYNFSQIILKQKLKGKGIVSKDLDKSTNLGGLLMGPEDENPSFEAMFQPGTLLRSNDDDDNRPFLQAIAKSGTESFTDGLNLREWLNFEGHKMSKSGSILIFKQIMELVDFAHSQGMVLQDLRPSCFTLSSSGKIKYIGSSGHLDLDKVMTYNVTRKRPMEHDICASQSLSTKLQKPCEDTRTVWQQQQHHFTGIHGCSTTTLNQTDPYMKRHIESRSKESLCHNGSNYQHTSTKEKQFTSVTMQLEEKWYCSPEELNDGVCTFSSNIYSLGVLLFELLCNIESWEVHSAVMSDLGHRILPPRFLSENSKEAGFCLWLLHPDPSSRPNTRMILESEFMHESEEANSGDDIAVSGEDEVETEQLLHFLSSLKDEKRKQAAKLAEELSCVDEDIKEIEKSYSFRTDSVFPLAKINYPSCSDVSRSIPSSSANESRFMSNINQLENSYFSTRFQVQLKEDSAVSSYDEDVLESRLRFPHVRNLNKEPKIIQSSVGRLGSFFEGLCKFSCYSKFEELGTLRNRDLLSSANVICALSFDRDEDYIAAAGVSKKIKIFDLSTILCDSVDIQYPVVEMSNKSKLSCVCWNSYIKNHLASTDYDGVVQMWDAGTGQPLSKYMEHQKRAWSVHFSLSDPKLFASGSDDCSVKLWNVSEENSIGTIQSPANVCCVQFNPYSKHLLFFGSADYKVYGYDLRQTRVPWCTLSGHGKAVSYVKFLDAETVVSASTDNSLKLWDLKKTSSSDACSLTFKGHSNEKNFVGLSVLDGYIACGSETNEVYCYHKSLPVPITSHKFESINPISGHSNSDDNNGQFVSSVCWRKKSNVLVAANSIGIVKLLQMV
ncbi:PREDICTED: protein SUPPRESSOR OF PHYA-105 1 isoform X1 [Lupinus angustifolius]|uniref:protein SUPPRESSOR OF PHYA-105 1 isoform X1 n=2 Tax=Lupinus angustifolius TaxID=3871 RepID=UPI00092EA864|nr:PREDICTED: protein SUPPRESSOR OF PHYA-105 1 isoform X1 [Lupinus angustifolius]XP_019429182.1 PREDICTED: protein SUPPRESSOR OF PHYA-105 1 isoform X1 [Lupinus angustifolius]